jgi:hypothetical protein
MPILAYGSLSQPENTSRPKMTLALPMVTLVRLVQPSNARRLLGLCSHRTPRARC